MRLFRSQMRHHSCVSFLLIYCRVRQCVQTCANWTHIITFLAADSIVQHNAFRYISYIYGNSLIHSIYINNPSISALTALTECSSVSQLIRVFVDISIIGLSSQSKCPFLKTARLCGQCNLQIVWAYLINLFTVPQGWTGRQSLHQLFTRILVSSTCPFPIRLWNGFMIRQIVCANSQRRSISDPKIRLSTGRHSSGT